MPNLFNLADLDTSIPDMANVAEASGHTAADLTSLTGEGADVASQADVPVMGCGNGAVPTAEIPVELQDVLEAHRLRRNPSVSGYGLWRVLEQAADLPQIEGIEPGFGPVS